MAHPPSTRQATKIASANAGWKTRREYQRDWSKQMMKESRYRLSGRTQRKGTTATSWQIWLVVARNITDAQAASPSQSKRVPMAGRSWEYVASRLLPSPRDAEGAGAAMVR